MNFYTKDLWEYQLIKLQFRLDSCFIITCKGLGWEQLFIDTNVGLTMKVIVHISFQNTIIFHVTELEAM